MEHPLRPTTISPNIQSHQSDTIFRLWPTKIVVSIRCAIENVVYARSAVVYQLPSPPTLTSICPCNNYVLKLNNHRLSMVCHRPTHSDHFRSFVVHFVHSIWLNDSFANEIEDYFGAKTIGSQRVAAAVWVVFAQTLHNIGKMFFDSRSLSLSNFEAFFSGVTTIQCEGGSISAIIAQTRENENNMKIEFFALNVRSMLSTSKINM